MLTSSPVLRYDNLGTFMELHADAIRDEIGAVTVQKDENGPMEEAVDSASRSLSNAEET